MAGPTTLSVCLATDAGYAVPTAALAVDIARRREACVSAVTVIWATRDPVPSELAEYLEKNGVGLRLISEEIRSEILLHIPHRKLVGTFTRLFIPEFITARGEDRVLYVDGDIQLVNSLSELAAVPLRSGQVAAAHGDSFVFNDDLDKRDLERKAYRLRLLSEERSRQYFNAGVMLADLDTWKNIGQRAWRFYCENSSLCRYYDESALNVVCEDVSFLSPRWNFQSRYFDTGLEQQIKPQLIHFNASKKPWNPLPFLRTWTGRHYYDEARQQMPLLDEVLVRKKNTIRFVGKAMSAMATQRTRSAFGLSRSRRRICERFLRSSVFADGRILL